MLDKTREDLHQAPLKGTLILWNTVPGGHRRVAGRQLGTFGNDAHFKLPLVGSNAVGIPTVVESAFVLIGPFLEDMVGSMGGAGRPVHQEGLVG